MAYWTSRTGKAAVDAIRTQVVWPTSHSKDRVSPRLMRVDCDVIRSRMGPELQSEA